MGGSLALWSATLAPQLTTAVGFYPALPWERMSPEWPSYEGKSAMIHCSEEDGTSAAAGIQQASAAIESAGGSVEIFDYPGTHHAFFNDDRPEVYDAAASAIAWDRTVAFLHRTALGVTALDGAARPTSSGCRRHRRDVWPSSTIGRRAAGRALGWSQWRETRRA